MNPARFCIALAAVFGVFAVAAAPARHEGGAAASSNGKIATGPFLAAIFTAAFVAITLIVAVKLMNAMTKDRDPVLYAKVKPSADPTKRS